MPLYQGLSHEAEIEFEAVAEGSSRSMGWGPCIRCISVSFTFIALMSIWSLDDVDVSIDINALKHTGLQDFVNRIEATQKQVVGSLDTILQHKDLIPCIEEEAQQQCSNEAEKKDTEKQNMCKEQKAMEQGGMTACEAAMCSAIAVGGSATVIASFIPIPYGGRIANAAKEAARLSYKTISVIRQSMRLRSIVVSIASTLRHFRMALLLAAGPVQVCELVIMTITFACSLNLARQTEFALGAGLWDHKLTFLVAGTLLLEILLSFGPGKLVLKQDVINVSVEVTPIMVCCPALLLAASCGGVHQSKSLARTGIFIALLAALVTSFFDELLGFASCQTCRVAVESIENACQRSADMIDNLSGSLCGVDIGFLMAPVKSIIDGASCPKMEWHETCDTICHAGTSVAVILGVSKLIARAMPLATTFMVVEGYLAAPLQLPIVMYPMLFVDLKTMLQGQESTHLFCVLGVIAYWSGLLLSSLNVFLPEEPKEDNSKARKISMIPPCSIPLLGVFLQYWMEWGRITKVVAQSWNMVSNTTDNFSDIAGIMNMSAFLRAPGVMNTSGPPDLSKLVSRRRVHGT